MANSPSTQPPVTFSQFQSSLYPSLNGIKAISATHADIRRSMLMVGYAGSQSAIAQVGRWRVRLLSAMVEGYLASDLSSTRYFFALEPSERVSMTFLLAQAFTHWVADAYMSVPILLHVNGIGATYTLSPTTAQPKTGAGPMKAESRPDFIGMSASGYHVFESKGRSLQLSSKLSPKVLAESCMKHALSQVSRIDQVNQKSPITRTAAVWIFQQTGVQGFVTDPPAQADAYDVKFDRREALLRYYRIILDTDKAIASADDNGFIRYRLDDTATLFADRKLVHILREIDQGSADPELALGYLADRAPGFARAGRLIRSRSVGSFGLDGVGLLTDQSAPDPILAD